MTHLQPQRLEIDEPPIDYQGPGYISVRKSRLWAYRDPACSTCYFDWNAGRGAACQLEMPSYDQVTNTIAYEDAIHTDGFGVYDAVASKFGPRHDGGLAHARRKFTDLGPAAPEVTLLVNCRSHDLDPEDYLVEVIKRLPPNAAPEQAAALPPARIAAERRTMAAAEEVA